MVGLGRLELPTPRLSSVCSNQLSYKPYYDPTLIALFLTLTIYSSVKERRASTQLSHN